MFERKEHDTEEMEAFFSSNMGGIPTYIFIDRGLVSLVLDVPGIPGVRST